MILFDTGALYALVDRNDVNHGGARKFYQGVVGKEILYSGKYSVSWKLKTQFLVTTLLNSTYPKLRYA